MEITAITRHWHSQEEFPEFVDIIGLLSESSRRAAIEERPEGDGTHNCDRDGRWNEV